MTCVIACRGGTKADSLTGNRPRRAEVLAGLRAADGPPGVADVAGRTGVHVNTARFHLETPHDLRAPVTATVLEPFAEPGACLVHLERASAA